MSVGPLEYSVITAGDVALAAAGTIKTILSVIAPANRTAKIHRIKVSFSGKTATDDMVEVSLWKGTADGTGTAVTPAVINAKGGTDSRAAAVTSKKNYSVEPAGTNLQIDEWLMDPNKMLGWFDLPLGRELETDVAGCFFVRALIPTGKTVTSGIRVAINGDDA